MKKSVIIKLCVTFVTGGLVALATAGLIPVSPEAINALCTAFGTALGGSFVNAKQ